MTSLLLQLLVVCFASHAALVAASPEQVVLRPPLSRNTSTCPGYRVVQAEETDLGHHLRLQLDGPPCHAFGIDRQHLAVEVEYQTDDRVRVNIYDEGRKHVTIPDEALPVPPSAGRRAKHPKLVFRYEERPFAFWISRKADDEIVFDIRHRSLIFEDQYIQLGSTLPEDANIYGLGEVASSSGFRRDPSNTTQTFWTHGDAVPMDSNLYGVHPVYLEWRKAGSHTVFLRNSHGMDVLLRPRSIEYRALGGTFDFSFIDGPTPLQAIQNYVSLIGLPQMQAKWTLGFHLCRWGYDTIDDLERVVDEMRKHRIPLDVQWSDIDYMDGYADFTIDEKRYPKNSFKRFIDKLHADGQHFVPIVDLGIAIGDNDAYQSGLDRDVYIKNFDNSVYSARVWPGYTTFPDFFAKNTEAWWRQAFKNFSSLVDFDGIWLDMNEAEIFCNGGCAPEDWPSYRPSAESEGLDSPPYRLGTIGDSLMNKNIRPSAKHANGLFQYNAHNLMGLVETRVTNKILRQLQPSKRPFLLSRSTFAGSGSVTTHWLGDNYATWEHLRLSIQGVLQFGIFGVPLVGPDICGFNLDASEELCGRWMQFGALAYPFMRNHNTLGTISQEPYVWKSVAAISREAVGLRYQLMPYLYTLLHIAARQGTPITRALFWEFPDEEGLLNADRQIMLGPSLLITPVLEKGATKVEGILPRGAIWRDFHSGAKIKSGIHQFKAPYGTLPVHIRGGSIVPLHVTSGLTIRETERRPYGMIIAPDEQGKAYGEVYFDDGISQDGASTLVTIHFSDGCLSWRSEGSYLIEPNVTSAFLCNHGMLDLIGANFNEAYEICIKSSDPPSL